VNLGIGIPTLVANYIPDGIDVEFQSENGFRHGSFLWRRDEDAYINAGKQNTTLPEPFDSALSLEWFGQHDLTILGAMEVSENGDIAGKFQENGKRNGRPWI
jgi:3-oxoacid CoA-transferase subunit B